MRFSEVTIEALKRVFPSEGAYLEGGNMFSMWLDLSPLKSATQVSSTPSCLSFHNSTLKPLSEASVWPKSQIRKMKNSPPKRIYENTASDVEVLHVFSFFIYESLGFHINEI